jgi:hypothetical protein
VGPRNFGVFGAQFFEPGDLGGMYENNPNVLYNRALHSFYFETLSEMGIVGVFALCWMLVDFWRRNAFLRTARAEQRWIERGGRMRLRYLALGLEACMVAFLVTAALYALSAMHWFWTLLALNLLLHALVKGRPPSTRSRQQGFGRVQATAQFRGQ